MQDFVLTHWARAAGLLAATGLVWAVFVPYPVPWIGLAWMTVAVSGALWLRLRAPRSIAQVIDDVEAPPVRAGK